MLVSILKSIFRILCGTSAQTVPSSDAYPPSQPKPPAHQVGHKTSYTSHSKHQDLNQVNQSNEYYVSLRAKANQHGDQMAQCFERSHRAYSDGDRALAKTLSNEGKEHQRQMEALNKQASDWIFIENNKDSQPDEIDLHGLYVKEAISHAEQAIQDAQRRGDHHLKFIVGKSRQGLHSKGGVAKIKPAIEELMQKYQLVAELDATNAGVLLVQLNVNGGENVGLGADDISRRLEKKDESCIIM